MLERIFYQVLHPWHWLTYGQNASGLGLIVLVLYTIYTRTMMLEAERARRGAMVPRLAIAVRRKAPYLEEVELINVGGPALDTQTFRLYDAESFRVTRYGLKPPTGTDQHSLGIILRDQPAVKLRVAPFAKGEPAMHIVECTDIFREKHQLIVVCTYIDAETCEYLSEWTGPDAWNRSALLSNIRIRFINLLLLVFRFRRKRKGKK